MGQVCSGLAVVSEHDSLWRPWLPAVSDTSDGALQCSKAVIIPLGSPSSKRRNTMMPPRPPLPPSPQVSSSKCAVLQSIAAEVEANATEEDVRRRKQQHRGYERLLPRVDGVVLEQVFLF